MGGFRENFRRARVDRLAAFAGVTPASPADDAPVSPPADGPSPIKLGYYHDREHGLIGEPNLYYGERGCLLFGLNGAGKSTRFLIELLMTAANISLVVLDLKGELAYQTADARRSFGDVKIVNPHGLHHLRSDGFNPIKLRCDDPLFFSNLTDVGMAGIDVEDKDPHWGEAAQSLFEGVIGYEVVLAEREGRPPSMANVRRMMCEPDEFETYTDAAGRSRKKLVKGLSLTVARIIAEGNPVIAGLVGRFAREHAQGELDSIISTADRNTKWILDPMVAADMATGAGVDFSQLKERPTTVYVIPSAPTPSGITKARRWTRMLIANALCSLMRPGPVRTVFVLDEMRAAVGNLSVLNDVWALVRGFGIVLMPIVQSGLQLKELFKDEWENYAAQAGMIATIGPPGDLFTAEWMSKRCGVTTVSQAGFNIGDAVSDGDNVHEGTGSGGNGMGTRNQGQGSNYGRNSSGGLSMQQVERRAFLPQELMDMLPGEGRIWVPGLGSKSIPFYAPPYWRRRAPWVPHVKRNPYR
jgi:type IV secretion system protein VirD4